MFDPLGNNLTRQLSHTTRSLLTRMQASHTWRAQHVQLKTQYDSYNCGVWAIWLSQELQAYKAQSSDASFQNWLMARLRLVPGDAGAKGDSLRHLDSQMRLLAQLRPLHEPNPPAIDDMPALADYAQAVSTGSSPYTRPHLSRLPPTDQATMRRETSSNISSNNKSCNPLAPKAIKAPKATKADTCPTTATHMDPHSPGATSDPCTKSRNTSKPQLRLKQAEALQPANLSLAAYSGSTTAATRTPVTSDAAAIVIRVLTWNVMGYTTIKSELRAIIEHHQPDALILTETKFVRDARLDHQLRQMLSDYQICISSRPKQTSSAFTEPQECL